MVPLITAVTEPVELGEGPHWSHEDQALYFVSILDRTIHKYVPASDKHTKTKFDNKPSFIIPVEGKKNYFVVGLQRNIVEVAWSGDEGGAQIVRVITEVETDIPGNSINDAKADPRGRLFFGTTGYQLKSEDFNPNKGSLYRMDPDGSTKVLATDINVSNGMCFDEQEKAFYYVDSLEYAVRRYDYDIETGDISNMKLIFKFKEHGLEGVPDGMTIDTDGNLWIANFLGHQVIKLDPRKGDRLQTVSIPALETTSCTFGGPSFDELYVTTAKIGIEQEQKPPCGSTFRVTGLGVRGYPNLNVKLQ